MELNKRGKIKVFLQALKGIILILVGSIGMVILITMNNEVKNNPMIEVKAEQKGINPESSISILNREFLSDATIDYNIPKKEDLKSVKIYKDKIIIKSEDTYGKEDITYKISEKESYKLKALYVLKTKINYTKIIIEVIIFEVILLVLIILAILVKEEYFTEEINYNE